MPAAEQNSDNIEHPTSRLSCSFFLFFLLGVGVSAYGVYYCRINLTEFPRYVLVGSPIDSILAPLLRYWQSRRRLFGRFSVGTSLPQSQEHGCSWGSSSRNGATQEEAKTSVLTPQTIPIATYRCKRAPTRMVRSQWELRWEPHCPRARNTWVVGGSYRRNGATQGKAKTYKTMYAPIAA